VYARDEKSKPIPLTIADFDKELGTITLVVQAVKAGTMKLLTMDVGETFYSLQGPLGSPSEIKKYYGTIICVAGGVGTAPIYPVIKALHEAGNSTKLIIGAREEKFLFWEEKIRPYADWTTVCIEKEPVACNRTPGFVTPYLEYYLERYLDSVSHVIAAGPLGILNAISKITEPRGVKYVASAVSHMLDGTGMCGGCQCNVGGETVLLCQKGPEIDGNLADWDKLIVRLNGLRKQEDEAFEEFKKTEEYAKFDAQEKAFAKGGAK
jgi:ferredoxin--NADP+ reductase